MARPTTWTKEKVEELAEKMELYFIGEKLKFDAEEKFKKIPFIGAFCRAVGISHETLLKKAAEYEKLSETLKNCKEIQKEMLIQGGLDGRFNATSFIFTAKNVTDMRDQTAVDVTSKGKALFSPTEVTDRVVNLLKSK